MAGNPALIVRIAANLAELKANLAEGKSQIETTTAAMTKLAASFQGDRLIQSAHNVVAAVNEVGGASKLTEAEMARVNATLAKAIEKYQVLGQEAPPAMVALAQATRKVADESRDVGAELEKFGSSARSAGITLTAALTLPIVGVGAAAIKLGIDAAESRNLIEVSFGDMTKAADQWAAQMSKDLGLNRYETEKTAGVLFNMTTSMGLGRAAAFEMSTGVVKLAGDMASFRNIPMEEALTKIKSGLTGETEPLKAIGILVDEATVKTYAYTHGIAAQGAELSAQQKVLARYGAILAQTSNDQGDLARTLESPANQLRIMKERVTEATTALGVSLLPMVQQVIGWVAQLVPKIQAAVEWFGSLSEPVKVAGVVFLGLVAAIGPALVVLGTLASSVASLIPALKLMGVETATLGKVATTAGTGMTLFASAASAIGVAFLGWQIGKQIADVQAFGLTIGEWVPVLWNWKLGLGESSLELLKTSEAANRGAAAQGAAAKIVAELTAQTKAATDAMRAEIAAQQAAAEAAAATAKATKDAAEAKAKVIKEIAAIEYDAHALAMDWTKELNDAKAKANLDQMKSTVAAIKDIATLEKEAATLRMGLYATDSEMKIQAAHDWFTDEVAKLNQSDLNYKQHYNALLDIESLRIAAIEQTNAQIVAGSAATADAMTAVFGHSAAEVASGYTGAFKQSTEALYSFAGAVTATSAEISAFFDAFANEIGTFGATSIGTPMNLGAGTRRAAGAGSSIAPGFAPTTSTTTRAAGGPVRAGTPYWVGERGPELFTPSASGGITPHGGGGSGSTIQIYVTQPLGTPEAIAAAVDAALTQRQAAIGTRY